MGGKKGNKSKKSTKTKTAVQKAAAERHTKFKQTKVQTFGGKKTSFSKSEQARIKAAGYSVSGYSKAKPNTSAQVAKDNAMYGNTVPAGSFGISEAGKAQAAANLAEKRLSAPGTYGTGMPSNPAYKGVGARETGPVRYKNSDYLTATPYVNAFQRTFGADATLQGNRFNPADRVAAQGAGLVDSGVGLFNSFKNMGPQGLLGFGKKIPNVGTLPKFQDANLQALRNFSSVAIPAAMTGGAAGRLNKVGLGQEVSQMTLGNAAFKAGVRPTLTKTGITGVNPLTIAKAFTPGMLKTGPTAGGSAAILGTATGLSAAQQAKSQQTGGLNIGGSSAEASEGETTSGSATGRTLGNRLLGGIDAVVGTDLDGRGGRTTQFGERLTDSIGAFGTLNQNLSDLSGQPTGPVNTAKNLVKSLAVGGKNLSMEDMAASTSFAKAFKDKPLDAVANINTDGSERVIKTLSTLDKNKDVSEALANYGGEGFQQGLRDTASFVTDNYDKLSPDAKENRKVVSDMLIGNDPRSEFAKRLAFQQKENPQLSMQSKIKYASDPNFKQYTGKGETGFENQIKGINRKEMGILGGLGNFVLSNQGRDVVTGNLPGTNNAVDLASNIINTGRDPSSSTYNQSQAFLRTIGAGGQPTAGSLIRGVLPNFGGRRGSSRSTTPNRGTGTTGTATPEELLIPQTPTYTAPTQTGTDSSNLQQIQQQSYMQNLAQLGITNLMQLPQFRTQQQRAPRRFRSFRRDYF
tara:strand:+ start:213 stop:2447 length:2235 start_codon:yes stop_codon:yes gene_type:complete